MRDIRGSIGIERGHPDAVRSLRAGRTTRQRRVPIQTCRVGCLPEASLWSAVGPRGRLGTARWSSGSPCAPDSRWSPRRSWPTCRRFVAVTIDVTQQIAQDARKRLGLFQKMPFPGKLTVWCVTSVINRSRYYYYFPAVGLRIAGES